MLKVLVVVQCLQNQKVQLLQVQKLVIGVKYDTNRVGTFTKTVTITSNAEGQKLQKYYYKRNYVVEEI
jgi:hypothetical protein